MSTKVEDMYRQIRAKKLRLGFKSIVLTTERGEEAFSGTGFLNQLIDGRFQLRLMVIATDRKWVAEINRAIPHDTDTRFRFTATDESGREWKHGELVKPYLADLFSAYENSYRDDYFQIVIDTPVVQLLDISEYDSVTSQPEDQEMSRCEFIVPGKFNIPTPHRHVKTIESNVDGKHQEFVFDHYKCSILGYSFHIRDRRDEGFLIGSFTGPAQEFPGFVDQKILEVLMFLSASVFNYPLVLRHNTNQAFIQLSGVVPATTSNLPPPVVHGEFWSAFECALSFLIKNSPSDPIFFPSFAAALDLMYSGFGTKANHDVGLSVGIETALNHCHISDPTSGDLLDKKQLAEIRRQVDTLDLNESVRQRVQGLVGILSSWSASDRLFKLERLGHIDERQITSWKKIRHRSAHGTDAKMSSAEYGDLYTLLNKIVLITVGYFGDVIDYGDKWGTK